MPTETIDSRLTLLEARFDELQRVFEERLPTVNTGENRGWRAILGAFADDPYYEEAMRLGREWREGQHDEIDRCGSLEEAEDGIGCSDCTYT